MPLVLTYRSTAGTSHCKCSSMGRRGLLLPAVVCVRTTVHPCTCPVSVMAATFQHMDIMSMGCCLCLQMQSTATAEAAAGLQTAMCCHPQAPQAMWADGIDAVARVGNVIMLMVQRQQLFTWFSKAAAAHTPNTPTHIRNQRCHPNVHRSARPISRCGAPARPAT